jgi:hypothetical protein
MLWEKQRFLLKGKLMRIIGDETRRSAPFPATNYVIGGVESETNSRVCWKPKSRVERQESEEKGGAGAEAALKSN